MGNCIFYRTNSNIHKNSFNSYEKFNLDAIVTLQFPRLIFCFELETLGLRFLDQFIKLSFFICTDKNAKRPIKSNKTTWTWQLPAAHSNLWNFIVFSKNDWFERNIYDNWLTRHHRNLIFSFVIEKSSRWSSFSFNIIIYRSHQPRSYALNCKYSIFASNVIDINCNYHKELCVKLEQEDAINVIEFQYRLHEIWKDDFLSKPPSKVTDTN